MTGAASTSVFTPQRPLRLFFLAGEASGDANAAYLVQQLKQEGVPVEVHAFGGERLAAEGAAIHLQSTDLGSLGLTQGLKRVPAYWRARRLLRRLLKELKPDLYVPVDFRAFNIRTLPFAQEAGVPVVYFFAPPVWGVQGIKRFVLLKEYGVHALLTFPFQKEFYEMAGVAHTAVGHPLLDRYPLDEPRAARRARLGGGEKPLVGLLPGSRGDELRRLLPVLAQVVARRPAWDFVLMPARQSQRAVLENFATQTGGRVRLFWGEKADFFGGTDALAACSGTVTLEAALMGTPMAIIYKVGWIEAAIYRLLVKQPFVGMPNILAGREVAPELLQQDCSPEQILSHLDGWLRDKTLWETTSQGLLSVREKLGEPGALGRSARALVTLAEQARKDSGE